MVRTQVISSIDGRPWVWREYRIMTQEDRTEQFEKERIEYCDKVGFTD